MTLRCVANVYKNTWNKCQAVSLVAQHDSRFIGNRLIETEIAISNANGIEVSDNFMAGFGITAGSNMLITRNEINELTRSPVKTFIQGGSPINLVITNNKFYIQFRPDETQKTGGLQFGSTGQQWRGLVISDNKFTVLDNPSTQGILSLRGTHIDTFFERNTMSNMRLISRASDGTLWALHLKADQRVAWTYCVDGSWGAEPTVVGDMLYIGDNAGTVHAIDAASGK